jgi:Lipocalin-like domain
MEQSEFRELVGSWRLQTLGITFSDTGERIDQFGPSPVGRMVLAATGRIMFLFGKPDRQPPTSVADRASLFDSMVSYTGTVTMDGPGRFITTIDLAMHPAVRGEQVRFFELAGDRLSIRTEEQTLPAYGNRLLIADLIWIREHS